MLDEEVIYQEAGQWLRMTNMLAWSIGAILIPVMLGAVWWALQLETDKCLEKFTLVAGSFLVWLVWLRMLLVYQDSTVPVRKALETIEREGGLGPERAFYSKQGPLFDKPWGPKFSIILFSAGLWLGWTIVLWPWMHPLLARICQTLECSPK